VVQLSHGARLAYAGDASDVALLRLNEPAPANAWFSGISATQLAAGDPIVTLHHPRGDLKKASEGRVVNPSEGVGMNLTSVQWVAGSTEPGSSGSGLFTRRDGEYLLRGTLRGGSASCTNSGAMADPSNRDYYSRLDADASAIDLLLRQAAGPLEDYSDIWSSTTDSGSGMNITQRPSGATFVVWFTYDAQGAPMWLTMQGGHWDTVSRLSGTVYRADRTGRAMAQQAIGQAVLSFLAPDRVDVETRIASSVTTSSYERFAF
jgi:hypothetical protein